MLGLLALLFFCQYLPRGSTECPANSSSCYESSGLVDCHNKSFTRVPQGLPHSAWFLDLSGNDLVELRAGSFDGLWSLRVLVLSNNGLQLLHNKALCHLSFLQKLDMSGNKLRRLPPDFSRCLAALRELRLDGNDLERLEPPSLDNLENLEKLDLRRNRVRTVAPRALWGLARLRRLYLQGNQLVTVQDGTLAMVLSLEVLLLGDNNITDIETEALTPLRRLSLLSLEGNRLRRLEFTTFLNLQTDGTHLRLSGNPWRCNCDLHRVFSKLQSVRRLHVDDYGNVTCSEPAQLAHIPLARVDSHLCMAETITVLVIAVTVLVTVVAAIVMAEHNRRKGRDSESESDFLDFQEK
ncbi:hypothetical protein SKAU_G00296730 [Synaphobranchus kaupii]|uniref:Uncharacterized protein n=1 Tax=Synaphobranchus kaupii TaxID=118154 RepID=A0A9Q1EUW2_SYNKA|nr:hypothetical protein SKAU_G00296730 [Synaphobranchus kaupii]